MKKIMIMSCLLVANAYAMNEDKRIRTLNDLLSVPFPSPGRIYLEEDKVRGISQFGLIAEEDDKIEIFRSIGLTASKNESANIVSSTGCKSSNNDLDEETEMMIHAGIMNHVREKMREREAIEYHIQHQRNPYESRIRKKTLRWLLQEQIKTGDLVINAEGRLVESNKHPIRYMSADNDMFTTSFERERSSDLLADYYHSNQPEIDRF